MISTLSFNAKRKQVATSQALVAISQVAYASSTAKTSETHECGIFSLGITEMHHTSLHQYHKNNASLLLPWSKPYGALSNLRGAGRSAILRC
jgi:hypothetical protein